MSENKPQEKEKAIVYGAGGHAKVVIDVLEKAGWMQIACLVDDNPRLKGRTVFGYPVVGGRRDLLAGSPPARSAIVAIGDNTGRLSAADWLQRHGFTLLTAVHPTAVLGRGVSVGAGTVILAGAVVNADSSIGKNVIINTRASIDHDSTLGDSVHVAPGATLCGGVHIGAGTLIGAGAIVTPNITVGRGVVIRAGTLVSRDVPDGVRFARELEEG